MTDIDSFISARLDEDEQLAREAGSTRSGKIASWRIACECEANHRDGCYECRVEGDNITIYDEGGHDEDQARHIVRHDPARVLTEVKAKRAILAEHACVWLYNQWVEDSDGHRHQGELKVCRACEPVRGFTTDQWPCRTLCLLAAPDDAHPDYSPAWRLE